MSFYVIDQAVYVQASGQFPVHCPECPAWIPMFKGYTVDVFLDDSELTFMPERKQ